MSCHQSVKAKKMPPPAVANGLQLDEIPQQLAELNSFESVFVARQIPVIKILALPCGRQKAIHGCEVNIPIEPEQLASVLPQVPTSETFITVKVKRNMTYRGHVFAHTVSPRKVRYAVRIIEEDLKNPLYADVLINDDWIDESMQQNQELLESLTGEGNDFSPDKQNQHDTQQETVVDPRHEVVTGELVQQVDKEQEENLI